MRRTTIVAVALAATLAGLTSATEEQTAGACAPIVAQTPDLPTDPLQRVAQKALRGDFGVIPAWKLAIYRKVVEKGLTAEKVAKRTSYCRKCAGTRCADGSRVRRGICAASPNIPMHSVIWLASDGLLKVCDRGGLVQVGRARWRGKWYNCTKGNETANFDVWKPRCVGHCWTGPGTMRRVPWALITGG